MKAVVSSKENVKGQPSPELPGCLGCSSSQMGARCILWQPPEAPREKGTFCLFPQVSSTDVLSNREARFCW